MTETLYHSGGQISGAPTETASARIDSLDSSGKSAGPLIDTGDRLVTPATASSNRAAAPVTLRDALAAWSDGSLAAHTQAVREAAKGYAGVRLTCADHPPGRKTCSHCRDAKKLLDRAKSKGPGHCYAGHFAFRHRYGLVALSRVVPLDFDGLDDPAGVRDSLASLPYSIGSRVSVSGRGVHALVWVDSLPEWDGLRPPGDFLDASRAGGGDARRAAYERAAAAHPQWVRRTEGLGGAYRRAWSRAVEQVRRDSNLMATADAQAKDVARLLFDSHDSDARVQIAVEPLLGDRDSDLANRARHALASIQPPSETARWMGLVYNCRSVGLPESEVDEWSKRGVRYQSGELQDGGHLPYLSLHPKETSERALTSLEAEAARQNKQFVPLKAGESPVSASIRGEERQCADPGAIAPDAGRASIYPGQDLAVEWRQVVDAIAGANEPTRLFSDAAFTSTLEWTGENVRPVTESRMGVIMSEACRFLAARKGGDRGLYPPTMLVRAVATLLPQSLPTLTGLKTCPFFFDGQLVTLREGFHAPSGYYCLMPEGIDAKLGAAECLRRLDDLLGEFPYAGEPDWANAIGLLVGQLLKVAYVSPMAFFDKPASQTGATLLARSIAALADGEEPSLMTVSERPEETDKRLITCLKARPSGIIIDNISFNLTSDILASGMTAEFIGGRLLGGNHEVWVPTKSVQFYLNGNNAVFERDLINRSIGVRLDSGMENPEERSGFRHVLPGAAIDRRGYYLSAAVSLVQRWIDAGRPSGEGPVLDSYRDWMRAVGGILKVAGVAGFNLNRDAFKDRADAGGAAEIAFVEAWLASGELTGMTAEALLPFVRGAFELNGEGGAGRSKALGHRLRQMVDKTYAVGVRRYAIRRHRGSRSVYSLEAL